MTDPFRQSSSKDIPTSILPCIELGFYNLDLDCHSGIKSRDKTEISLIGGIDVVRFPCIVQTKDEWKGGGKG